MSAPFVHTLFGPLHLGRPQVSKRTHRTMAKAFRMHDFLSSLPPAPVVFDNTSGIGSWGQMLNDNLGDCTCATGGHLIQAWTAAAGAEVTVPDSAVLTAYEAVGGYIPGNPNTDQGAQIVDLLNYFQSVGIGGHQISAHAEVNLTQLRVQQAVYMSGAVDIGVQLPISAQAQVGGTWDIVNFAQSPDAQIGSWGGHSVPIVKYDSTGLWCVTWGALQYMTWRFFMYYVDEAHACISPDYSKSPVSRTDLIMDLTAIGS